MSAKAPERVRVAFTVADTHSTYCAIVHENESRPYKRRVVVIDLTPEQLAQLRLACVGNLAGAAVHEEILDARLERDAPTPEAPASTTKEG